jgi:hypothetical protein
VRATLERLLHERHAPGARAIDQQLSSDADSAIAKVREALDATLVEIRPGVPTMGVNSKRTQRRNQFEGAVADPRTGADQADDPVTAVPPPQSEPIARPVPPPPPEQAALFAGAVTTPPVAPEPIAEPAAEAPAHPTSALDTISIEAERSTEITPQVTTRVTSALREPGEVVVEEVRVAREPEVVTPPQSGDVEVPGIPREVVLVIDPKPAVTRRAQSETPAGESRELLDSEPAFDESEVQVDDYPVDAPDLTNAPGPVHAPRRESPGSKRTLLWITVERVRQGGVPALWLKLSPAPTANLDDVTFTVEEHGHRLLAGPARLTHNGYRVSRQTSRLRLGIKMNGRGGNHVP